MMTSRITNDRCNAENASGRLAYQSAGEHEFVASSRKQTNRASDFAFDVFAAPHFRTGRYEVVRCRWRSGNFTFGALGFLTPEVQMDRDTWLKRYSATKLVIRGILEPLGKGDMMPEIFDDLAEVHRAHGVYDDDGSAGEASAG